MRRQLNFTEECRRLAKDARAITGGRDVLYHGTRYPRSILRMNVLFYSYPGSGQVALTRCPEMAAYFAVMERDDDEDSGAILVFDRNSMRCRYRLEPWHDVQRDEMEERIWWRDVKTVDRYLMGVVFSPRRTESSARQKQNNRRRQLEMTLRAAGLEPQLAYQLAGLTDEPLRDVADARQDCGEQDANSELSGSAQ